LVHTNPTSRRAEQAGVRERKEKCEKHMRTVVCGPWPVWLESEARTNQAEARCRRGTRPRRWGRSQFRLMWCVVIDFSRFCLIYRKYRSIYHDFVRFLKKIKKLKFEFGPILLKFVETSRDRYWGHIDIWNLGGASRSPLMSSSRCLRR
jgi:hypothetical protein